MADVKHFEPDVVLDSVMDLFWRQGAAATGISEIVSETGVNRSSLYATFGGKRDLYLAALRRYVVRWSAPAFQWLAEDERGLAGIRAFFDELIEVRCSGPNARWGCLIANAHAAEDNADPDVRSVLAAHHDHLRGSMRLALERARVAGELRAGVAIEQVADLLAMLAYGVNLRSRAGAAPERLRETVAATLDLLTAGDGGGASGEGVHPAQGVG